MKKIFIFALFIYSVLLYGCAAQLNNPNKLYFRVNQVGFLPGDLKTAVILTNGPVLNKNFTLVNKKNEVVYEGEIQDSSLKYGNFSNCYSLDFSTFKKEGEFTIKVDNQKSPSFRISNTIFNNIADSLLLFFKVQRCGPTQPHLHGKCHLSDVSHLVGNSGKADLTGGWHDAGDYIKFLSTTAYTTYLLMFAYEFDPVKFGFDNNNNTVPDILEEAKVGIDWMLRANYKGANLVTQVQDSKDHEVGFRLPENDPLQYERPGFIGAGKNQIGFFSAVMALANRIWSSKFYEHEFAAKCLAAGENLYKIRNNVSDVDKNISGVYQDKSFWGKLALGAIELYNSTNNPDYLKDAYLYADSAGSDYWWSWGDINSLAHFKIAKQNIRYKDYIYANLNAFNQNKDNQLFKEGMAYTWGSNNSFLGIALQAILYKSLTNENTFDSLAFYQRDYILGRNPWGLSFIHGIGKVYPKNLHSQIGALKGGYLPGALSAGGAPVEILKKFDIKRTNSKYDNFNSLEIQYFDDVNDYITNEPTITGNATALFVYGYFSQRK